MYLEALETLSKLKTIEGSYLQSPPVRCNICESCYYCKCRNPRPYTKREEKGTDVNIALHLLSDAFLDKYDFAYLVTGDTDLVPAVECVKTNCPDKTIIVCFPPNRVSPKLKNVCDASRKMFDKIFEKSQFPDILDNKSNYPIQRPSSWR